MSVEVSVAEAKDARAEHVERAMRALQISGRRLAKTSAGWSVTSGVDRRCWARLVLEDHEVERLAGDGRLTLASEDAYVLARRAHRACAADRAVGFHDCGQA
jgi:hypothetical protein